MIKKGTFKPRPHARIITMIGDQLIRNEKVALMEVIKNSYDADASWVQIRFINFDVDKKDPNDLRIRDNSIIEIEDDGIGMTFDTIEKSWVNPASPFKFLLKKQGKDRTKQGRVIQGEKGIGRFAVYKLGSTIEIFTRPPKNKNEEIYLRSDLSMYDEELISKKDSKDKTPIFIDDIEYKYEIREPETIKERKIFIKNRSIRRKPYGTLIRISNLKGYWTRDKIKNIFDDCLKLVSPFNKTEFECDIILNGETMFTSTESSRLDNLLEIAPISIQGKVDEKGNLSFKFKGHKKEENKTFEDMSENLELREHFYDKGGKLKRYPICGPFSFKFYVFDLERRASLESPLSTEDREIIKSHRIYLYRDGIRVYPYGDPTDDWLGLDILRGTVRAGGYLSNDQVVGYVEITSKDNSNLRDETNREGLMHIGYSYDDFKTLILGLFGFLNLEFKKYKHSKQIRQEEQEKKEGILAHEQKVKQELDNLLKHLSKSKDKKGTKIVKGLSEAYEKETQVLNERVEIVEDLAGVGMTVDAASHDLIIMMDRAKETLNLLFDMTKKGDFDIKKLKDSLEKLRGQFAFIEDQLHGIQPLFRSSRRYSKNMRIKEILEKVQLYYSVPIKDKKIEVKIKEKGSPLIVKSSEGILLQVFINLMDNAIYWLTINDKKDKKIEILLDGEKLEVTFADSGPGIKDTDLPFIFTPFFSTKGIRGRGLGLYITRQLLDRYDCQIGYIRKNKYKLLKGANFLINFTGSGKEE